MYAQVEGQVRLVASEVIPLDPSIHTSRIYILHRSIDTSAFATKLNKARFRSVALSECCYIGNSACRSFKHRSRAMSEKKMSEQRDVPVEN